MNGQKPFRNFKVVRATKDDKGNTHWKRVGDLYIDDKGKGKLFLNMFSEEYLVFPSDEDKAVG